MLLHALKGFKQISPKTKKQNVHRGLKAHCTDYLNCLPSVIFHSINIFSTASEHSLLERNGI